MCYSVLRCQKRVHVLTSVWSVIQLVSVCCSVLQCGAYQKRAHVHTSVLQCVTVCCSVLWCDECVTVCFSAWQCVVVCCSVLSVKRGRMPALVILLPRPPSTRPETDTEGERQREF